MNMQQVLINLENTLPTEFKEAVIAQFNIMYETNVTTINEDERIFSALYLILIKTLSTVGAELFETANSDDEDLDGIEPEDIKGFKLSAGYAAHVMEMAMEVAEVSSVMKAINAEH